MREQLSVLEDEVREYTECRQRLQQQLQPAEQPGDQSDLAAAASTGNLAIEKDLELASVSSSSSLLFSSLLFSSLLFSSLLSSLLHI